MSLKTLHLIKLSGSLTAFFNACFILVHFLTISFYDKLN